MTKYFDVSKGIVFGRVYRILSPESFLVQNGEPRHIFCHHNQGGTLEVSREGHLLLKQNRDQSIFPSVGERIVLIRETSEPTQRAFTRAYMWVGEEDWQESKWAVNARTTFRAVACDHRHDGKCQPNTKTEVILTTDILTNIAGMNPRNSNNDPLGEHYSVEFGKQTLSYKVHWERLGSNGTWTECDDPRPVH